MFCGKPRSVVPTSGRPCQWNREKLLMKVVSPDFQTVVVLFRTSVNGEAERFRGTVLVFVSSSFHNCHYHSMQGEFAVFYSRASSRQLYGSRGAVFILRNGIWYGIVLTQHQISLFDGYYTGLFFQIGNRFISFGIIIFIELTLVK